MMRLDSATLESNPKRFVGVAEGVYAITLNKNDSIEYEQDQSTSQRFLAIRKCKAAVSSSAINVSLDGTNFSWSPNLHLRLFKLWNESADFRNIVNSNPKIANIIKGLDSLVKII